MKKIIKYFLVFLVVIGAILFAFLTRIERIPFRQTAHFLKWKNEINNYSFPETKGKVSVGWALENITPRGSAPLAGYGKRKGQHYTSVHDSIFVRSIALREGVRTIYFVSADLLFIPPKVINRVEEKLRKSNIKLRDIHFSATHSHSSIGGWESTLTGELFGGKYDPEIIEFLSDRFNMAILKSSNNLSPGKVLYSEVIDDADVRYRVNLPDGSRDTEIRSLSFVKNNGEKAYLLTYAAHNTVLSDRNMLLSRDYAGAVVDSLSPAFGVFMAGAVASMGPVEVGKTEYDEVKNQAGGILSSFSKRKELALDEGIISEYLEIPLPPPNARISKDFALRSWVFKKFFGNYKNYLKVSKVGNTLLLGMPADFSGEIMVRLDKYAAERNLNLIITSFNGSYMGYITDDKIYDSGHYETVTMSWYGYEIGGYFEQMAKDIIDKLGNP